MNLLRYRRPYCSPSEKVALAIFLGIVLTGILWTSATWRSINERSNELIAQGEALRIEIQRIHEENAEALVTSRRAADLARRLRELSDQMAAEQANKVADNAKPRRK